MELRQLKYFLSAARNLSFTTAARECYIVQSAMSQQIAALEKELGYPPVETVHIGACISINIGPDVIAVCYKHQ